MKDFYKSNLFFLFFSFLLWFLLTSSHSLAQHGKIPKIVNRSEWIGTKVLDSDFTVGVNDELIIHPGTNIDCKSYRIYIEGKFTAVGLPDFGKSITFTSTSIGGWKGIYFNTPHTAVMRYCNITRARPGPDPTVSNRNVNAGAIYATQTSMIIDFCRFYNNFGGIRTQNFSYAEITNCSFTNNRINEENAGLIYIESSSKDSIANNLFDLNKVNRDGVISVNYNSECRIHNNIFKNTEFVPLTPKYDGSVIISNYSIFPNIMKITFNTFKNNGGIDISVTGTSDNFNNSYSFIFKNTFEADNSEATFSKGVYAFQSKVYVISCVFSNYDQAAIEIKNATSEIQSNIFYKNHSKLPEIGSSIHFDYKDYNSINEFTNRIFSNRMFENVGDNSATVTLLIDQQQQPGSIIPKFIFNGNRFFENFNDAGNGGAISINAESPIQYLEFTNNRFQSNTSAINGGAIYLSKISNQSNISKNYFLENFSVKSGGALMMSDISSAASLKLNNFYFNKSALNGGAVALINSQGNDQTSFSLYLNKFFCNNASINGGAIYCSRNSVDIDTNRMLYNKSENGGAIYFDELFGNSAIRRSFIFADTATKSGGGLYLVQDSISNKTINLEDNVFQSNIYREFGGAMYFNGNQSNSKVIIKRNMINQNKFLSGMISHVGGGIYAKDQELELINSIVHNNLASKDRGALAISNPDKNFKLLNSDVIFNPIAGGMNFIAFPDPTNLFEIKNSIFCGQNNKSIIWDNGEHKLEISNCFFDYLPPLIDTINCVNFNNPGFVNNASDFHLLNNSLCIDKGLSGGEFNDIEDYSNPGHALYPSLGLMRNDIGATGGPEVINRNTSYSNTGVKPLFANFQVTIIDDINRKIKIVNQSVVNDPPSIYHFFFGDGEDMILSGNFVDLEYEYSSFTSKNSFEITLVLQNIDNMKYCKKVVNFSTLQSNYEEQNQFDINDIRIIENNSEIIAIFPVENVEFIDFNNLSNLNSLNHCKYRFDTIIWKRPVLKVENHKGFSEEINTILNQNENLAFEKSQDQLKNLIEDITMQILSNPCEEKLLLQINSEDIQNISLQLFDIMGNCVYFENHLIDGSLYLEINLCGKLPGIYFLKATGGLSAITKKIILK